MQVFASVFPTTLGATAGFVTRGSPSTGRFVCVSLRAYLIIFCVCFARFLVCSAQLNSMPSLYCKSGDCRLGPWTGWARCSASCGSNGTTTRYFRLMARKHQQIIGSTVAHRTRSIIMPSKNSGSACDMTLETTACPTVVCPSDCVLSSWGETRFPCHY